MGAEFGDFSVTQLLTGWAPQAVALEPDKRDSIWHNLLLPSLPLWVRDNDENERVAARSCLVLASFRIPEEQQLTNTEVSKQFEYCTSNLYNYFVHLSLLIHSQRLRLFSKKLESSPLRLTRPPLLCFHCC